MGKLQAAFPEIKEEKFKAVMFDLMMEIESGEVPAAGINYPYPRGGQEITELGSDKVVDTLPAHPINSLVGPPVSWGDVGGKGKKLDTEAGFDFEESPQAPAPLRAPAKRGKLTKEEKEARRQEADQFTGLTDKEIAQKLTERLESKQRKDGGQFTSLGGDGPPGEDFLVG